jgi:hypothetical protein
VILLLRFADVVEDEEVEAFWSARTGREVAGDREGLVIEAEVSMMATILVRIFPSCCIGGSTVPRALPSRALLLFTKWDCGD